MKDELADQAMLLLSEGLDLCVRAKKLDELVTRAVATTPTGTRCLTPALWAQDQYDRDLTAWEDRSRAFLTKHTPVGGPAR